MLDRIAQELADAAGQTWHILTTAEQAPHYACAERIQEDLRGGGFLIPARSSLAEIEAQAKEVETYEAIVEELQALHEAITTYIVKPTPGQAKSYKTQLQDTADKLLTILQKRPT